MTKIGRNDACHCGSGKKYKHCHLATDTSERQSRTLRFLAEGTFSGGLPGAHSDLVLNPTGQQDSGKYTVIVTLMRPMEPPIPSDLVTNHEHFDGSSQILFAAPGIVPKAVRKINVCTNEKTWVIEAFANATGHLGKLRITGVKARTYREARDIANGILQDLLSNIALMYDVPMEVFRTDVVDEVTSTQYITVRTPFSTGVWDVDPSFDDDLNRCAALYREALNSNSDFYGFLCLYKIIEIADGLAQSDAATAVQRGKAPRKRSRYVVPDTKHDIREWVRVLFPGYYQWTDFELENVAPKETRGEKFGKIREQYLRPLRNSIAHGLLDDKGVIDVDDPALLHQVRYWLPYTRLMSRRLIFDWVFPRA